MKQVAIGILIILAGTALQRLVTLYPAEPSAPPR